jgi:hypothetical protein
VRNGDAFHANRLHLVVARFPCSGSRVGCGKCCSEPCQRRHRGWIFGFCDWRFGYCYWRVCCFDWRFGYFDWRFGDFDWRFRYSDWHFSFI